ncbi:MAG: methyltransferase domain-containing protein [Acidobacteriota bacterium]|nr:methyltransferase domain-containing protein [Acidobacteriota bacterium]
MTASPASEVEILDGYELSPAEFRRALRDLRRVNRLIFGSSVARRTMIPLVVRHRGPATLLDVAAGTGDVAAATAAAAARVGVDMRVVSVDLKLGHLVYGRCLGDVRRPVVACASALPFADSSVTWSLSTLFLHHLDTAGKERACLEMTRVSARESVIVDLMPTWWVRGLARLLLPILLLGRVARRDGYVSLRRSWTASQWRRFFSDRVGARIDTFFPARVAIVLEDRPPSA